MLCLYVDIGFGVRVSRVHKRNKIVIQDWVVVVPVGYFSFIIRAYVIFYVEPRLVCLSLIHNLKMYLGRYCLSLMCSAGNQLNFVMLIHLCSLRKTPSNVARYFVKGDAVRYASHNLLRNRMIAQTAEKSEGSHCHRLTAPLFSFYWPH